MFFNDVRNYYFARARPEQNYTQITFVFIKNFSRLHATPDASVKAEPFVPEVLLVLPVPLAV